MNPNLFKIHVCSRFTLTKTLRTNLFVGQAFGFQFQKNIGAAIQYLREIWNMSSRNTGVLYPSIKRKNTYFMKRFVSSNCECFLRSDRNLYATIPLLQSRNVVVCFYDDFNCQKIKQKWWNKRIKFNKQREKYRWHLISSRRHI